MNCCEHYSGTSILHSLDPRLKLICLAMLAFTYSFLSSPVLLMAMILATFTLFMVSGLPGGFILARLKLPSFIILILVFTLPLISGDTVLFSLGPVSLKQEGLYSALLMAVRFFCIISTAMIILNTSPLLTYIKAVRAMGMPWIMADMAFLVFRYLQVIGDDYKRMKTSMKIRGFEGNRLSLGTLRTISWLTGGLLVRSLERSDWIYRSMRNRGYGSAGRSQHEFKAGRFDLAVSGAVIMTALCLAVLEIWLGR